MSTPAGMVDTVLAGGYLGKIVRSIDHGQTWSKVNQDPGASGGEDGVIRSIAYGNGVWVAGGYPFWWTSSDTNSWTKHDDVGSRICLEALAFFKGKFYAACGAAVFSSSDGQAWTNPSPRVGEIGNIHVQNGGTDHCYLEAGFDQGVEKLAIFSVEGELSYSSLDGSSWQPLGASYPSVTFCKGALHKSADCGGGIEGFGSLFRVVEGNIERSSDGLDWQPVYTEGGINRSGDHNVLAFGYSPAP